MSATLTPNISAYPTLLFLDADHTIHRLPATGAPLAALNTHLDGLLA